VDMQGSDKGSGGIVDLVTVPGRMFRGGCALPLDLGIAPDMVERPPHYNTGNIEVLDFILDQKLGYLEGNVVKYICRAKHKGNELQDLKKAAYYLNKRIEELSGSSE